MNKNSIYKPYKELILNGKANKLNSIIQNDINKKDYNSIKDMLEEKQEIIIKNNDIKTKKILQSSNANRELLPPETSNKKKYLKK